MRTLRSEVSSRASKAAWWIVEFVALVAGPCGKRDVCFALDIRSNICAYHVPKGKKTVRSPNERSGLPFIQLSWDVNSDFRGGAAQDGTDACGGLDQLGFGRLEFMVSVEASVYHTHACAVVLKAIGRKSRF